MDDDDDNDPLFRKVATQVAEEHADFARRASERSLYDLLCRWGDRNRQEWRGMNEEGLRRRIEDLATAWEGLMLDVDSRSARCAKGRRASGHADATVKDAVAYGRQEALSRALAILADEPSADVAQVLRRALHRAKDAAQSVYRKVERRRNKEVAAATLVVDGQEGLTEVAPGPDGSWLGAASQPPGPEASCWVNELIAMGRPDARRPKGITLEHIQVLVYKAQGLTVREIAVQMRMSVGKVQSLVDGIRAHAEELTGRRC